SASRCLTVAWALAICDSLIWICASTDFSCSRVLSNSVRALSSSAGEMNPLSTSIFLRLRSRSASASATLTRPTSAPCAARFDIATATALREASTSARVWLTRSSKLCGSMRAMTWSFFTWVLKSAKISMICPETWEPTCTVVTAFSVPLATTTACSGPRSTAPMRYLVSPAALREAYQAQAPAHAATSTSTATILPRLNFIGASIDHSSQAQFPWIWRVTKCFLFSCAAAVVSRLAAAFFLQLQSVNDHAAVHSLHHVVDREQSDRGGRERLHLNTRAAAALHRRDEEDLEAYRVVFELHRNPRDRDRVRERQQVGSALRRLDRCHARHAQHVALVRAALDHHAKSRRPHADAPRGDRNAVRFALRADVDHVGAAFVVEMRESGRELACQNVLLALPAGAGNSKLG